MASRTSSDISTIFNRNKKILTLCGFWKPEKYSGSRKVYFVYTCAIISLLVLFVTPQVLYMAANATDINKVSETLYISCCAFIVMIKSIAFYLNVAKAQKIVREFKTNDLFQMIRRNKLDFLHRYMTMDETCLHDFTPKSNRQLSESTGHDEAAPKSGRMQQLTAKVTCERHLKIVQRTKILGDVLFYLGIFCGTLTQLFWSIKPLLARERTLPIKGWFPYNSTRTPYFELTNWMQTSTSSFCILHTVNIDSFAVNLILSIGAQCDILKYNLENLNKFQTRHGVLQKRNTEMEHHQKYFVQEMKNNLKICIQHYDLIKRITKMVEDLYHVAFLALIIGGGFIFCTISYQLLLVQIGSTEFFYLLFYLFSMLTQQSAFCFLGTELTFKSERLFSAASNIPHWIYCDLSFKKMMTIYYTSLQKPLVLYAGRLIPLSVDALINVLRTSYSYFTLLRNI
ncbi:odorant receptor 49b-like [Rhynchophorus ferrugineus]|uniref:odorant receptor 49b-like n=1 Tax=Rhynchophorus ferrugineus TaxID=354439 RepID=UPI003FCEDF7E